MYYTYVYIHTCIHTYIHTHTHTHTHTRTYIHTYIQCFYVSEQLSEMGFGEDFEKIHAELVKHNMNLSGTNFFLLFPQKYLF